MGKLSFKIRDEKTKEGFYQFILRVPNFPKEEDLPPINLKFKLLNPKNNNNEKNKKEEKLNEKTLKIQLIKKQDKKESKKKNVQIIKVSNAQD